MRTIKLLLLGLLSVVFASCSDKDEEESDRNSGYTEVQHKALSLLNGIWVAEEVKMKHELGGTVIEMVAVNADTLVFLTQYTSPQTFYVFDYLQGKETENFVACGTCELRLGGSLIPDFSPTCYFYVSPSGDALTLYNVETEQLVRSFDFRAETATRFYAGPFVYGSYSAPIIFNKQ